MGRKMETEGYHFLLSIDWILYWKLAILLILAFSFYIGYSHSLISLRQQFYGCLAGSLACSGSYELKAFSLSN
jgi:hypothetical protein